MAIQLKASGIVSRSVICAKEEGSSFLLQLQYRYSDSYTQDTDWWQLTANQCYFAHHHLHFLRAVPVTKKHQKQNLKPT